MKNTLNVVRQQLKVLIALGLLAILIIETIRPMTGFPVPWTRPTNVPDGLKPPHDVLGNNWGQFAYFTVWTNVLFVLTIVIAWVFRVKISPYWRNAIATYLMVMLIVFFAVLAPQINWKQNWWITFILLWQHLGVVIIGLWWFFTTKSETKTKLGPSMLLTITIPILYLVLATVMYFLFNVYTYNFLNFKNVFGKNLNIYGSYAISIGIIIGIAIITLGFNWLFVIINNNGKALSVKRGKKSKTVSKKRRAISFIKKMNKPQLRKQVSQNIEIDADTVTNMKESPEVILEEITIEIPVVDDKKQKSTWKIYKRLFDRKGAEKQGNPPKKSSNKKSKKT